MARLRKRLAAALRRVANRLDPPAKPQPYYAVVDQVAVAEQLAGEMQLRAALHAALNPREHRAQA